ncbi:MAG: hypothetical protein AAF687_13890 [Pseudomonadota bacterium]
MPRTAYNAFARKSFKSADWLAEANKHERIATLADEDGDTHHAQLARNEAALCRQRARELEAKQWRDQ